MRWPDLSHYNSFYLTHYSEWTERIRIDDYTGWKSKDAIDFSSLKALQEIVIGRCCFQLSRACLFCGLPNLRSIQINRKCFICSKGTLVIKDCKQLSSIVIDSNCFTCFALAMKSTLNVLRQG